MSSLSHSQSVVKLSEIENRPAHSLVRSSSLYDVNKFNRSVERFTPARSFLVHNDTRPLWDHTFYRDVVGSQQPRFHRPAYQMDSYWWDKYYYFSPLYKGTQPFKRHYASHRVTFPCSWNEPHIYWARYKGYWYDSEDDYAPLYRRCFEPYANDSPHQLRFWNRYRSHLLNNDVYG